MIQPYYSNPEVDPARVRDKYIFNQAELHRKVSFSEEYEEFLKFYQKTLQPFEKHHSK